MDFHIYLPVCTATTAKDFFFAKASSVHRVDMILFYNGRNSPESSQAHDTALGGYIIQIKITSRMKVPCRCKHTPRHLGANA